MSIKIKHTDPSINELATDDLIVNVEQGSLFFRSYEKLYKLQGDDLSTSVTESGAGDDMWLRSGNNLYYNGGNIGIGTNTPQHDLHIISKGTDNADGAVIKVGTNDVNGGGYIQSNWHSGDYNFIHLGSSYYDGSNWITNEDALWGSNHRVQLVLKSAGFYFVGSNSTGNTAISEDTSTFLGHTKMMIKDTGEVGIGTSNPSFTLTVSSSNASNANDATIEIETGAGVSGSGSRLHMGGTATYSFIQTHSSQPLAINPLGADTNNFVGIGTTTPSAPLMVRGDIGLGDLTTNSRMAGRDQIRLMSDTNGYGAGIGFTDQVTGGGRWDDASQHGTLRFYHSDNHMLGAGAAFKLSSNQPLELDVGGNLYLTKDDAALVMGATGSSNANFTSRIQFKETSDPFDHGAEIIFNGDFSGGGSLELGVRDGSTSFHPAIRIDRRCAVSGSAATPTMIFGSDGFVNFYNLLRIRNRDIGANNENKHRSGMYLDTRTCSGMKGQFDPLNGGTNGHPRGTAAATGAVQRNLIYL